MLRFRTLSNFLRKKCEELTNAQPDRDDPNNLCKYGLETEPQFLDKCQVKENWDYLFKMFPKCTQKLRQGAVMPGATHCTDSK